jgi:mono/diheme cytochrome c family protein/uncharacterized membrane protein
MKNFFSRALAKTPAERAAWFAALVLIATLLLLPFIFRLDGRAHADWQQFVGRFHPLAVHIPIGLIVLVPLLEIAGARKPALREAAGFVLALACAACLVTLALGYLLAYGSGDTASTVTRHLWGGIALAITLLLCLLTRPIWSAGVDLRLYPVVLTTVMLILVWTAHQGGSLTHGSNYLTQYMPASLQRIGALTSVNAAVPNPDSFYARRIHPLLDSHCVSCHGAGKVQGGLRLDTYEGLLRGGKSGPAVVPNQPEKSMMLTRVTLPATDKHFMPAEGRTPLGPDEIASIRAWVQQGASSTATVIAGVANPPASDSPPPQPVGDYSALSGEIEQMRRSQGAKLLAVSSTPSDGLILNTFDAATSFDDAQLAQMQKFAPFIVEANLARTGITDASFETLSHFTHLRSLHLEGTKISGNGLAKLAGLSQLSYLNLSETKVTGRAVALLKSMPRLRHLYLFDTPAEPATLHNSEGTKAGGVQ